MARGFLLILLLLAVSPVTAPFSSCELGDLLSGAPSDGAAVVQAKSSDTWAPGLSAGADLDLRGWVFPPSAGAVQEHRGEPLRVPLRV